MRYIKLFEEFTNEKTVTVDWNDDENSLIFSDAGLIKVDYDGEFKYRNKWFSTAEHEGPEDLIKDLTSAFRADKFVYANESFINEAKELSRDEMMKIMHTKYGLNFVKKSEEFDGEKDGIWLGGSDSLMPNAKDQMFNYYNNGSKYPQGVHKDLAKFLDKCGWYGQFADPGTVMLWPKN
jgi:hypothetical protein